MPASVRLFGAPRGSADDARMVATCGTRRLPAGAGFALMEQIAAGSALVPGDAVVLDADKVRVYACVVRGRDLGGANVVELRLPYP